MRLVHLGEAPNRPQRVSARAALVTLPSFMAINEDMDRISEFAMRFRLWRVDTRNDHVAIVAEADTLEEITSVRRRSDWRYQITCNGFPLCEQSDALLGQAPLKIVSSG